MTYPALDSTTEAPRRSLLIHDAALLLGVSRRTVYYRIRDGRLATVRTRCGSQRVLVDSIEQLLREERGLVPCARAMGRDADRRAVA